MAFFSFNLKTGTGPFTIVVREATETRNRYISGTIPGVIEYEEIPDGLPHEYVLQITSPSCEPFEGKFTFQSPCKAKPALNVAQDCVAFSTTGKTYLKINSSLQEFSTVLIQVYDGTSVIFNGIIDSSVEKSIEVPNNKSLRIRASNPLYSTCFTEITYSTACKSENVCDVELVVEVVTPDTVISYTPIPNIVSAKVDGTQVTVTGTSVCNGTIRLYKRSGTSFNPITERTIPVTNGEWSYTFTGTSGTYAADAYCTNYTNPSQLSFGFDSVLVPVIPDPDPEPVNAVISRAAIDYFPGGNTFLTTQVDPFSVVQAQLTSPNNSTQWLDVTDWGSTVGGKTYNTRLVLPNFPAGTYTIKLRVKGSTDVITVNNVSISGQGAYSFYPVVTIPDPGEPPIPTDPTDLTIPADAITNVPDALVYMQNDTVEVGFHLGWGGSVVGVWWLGTRNPNLSFLKDPANLVNDTDYGRQLQYAYYGWPINDTEFRPGGQSAYFPFWKDMGWDPIQAGDCCTPSRVSQYKLYDGGKKLYVRTHPRHWGYCNSEAQCYVETFYIMEGKAMRWYNTLVNQRTDYFKNLPRGQDIAGGFIRRDYDTSNVYFGNQPWTNQALSKYKLKQPDYNNVEGANDGAFQFCATENWVALSSEQEGPNRCIGLWSPSSFFSHSVVGFTDTVELPEKGNCVTMGNHIFLDKMDRNIVYSTQTAFVFGTLNDIRSYAQSRRGDVFKMNWDFSRDRQHWWTQGAYDNGQESSYPFQGYWEIKYDYEISNFCSAESSYNIGDYNRIDFEIAVTGNSSNKCAFNMHKKLNNGKRFNDAFEDCAYDFQTINDGQFRTYTVDLTKNPKWNTGTIIRMYVDFGGTKEPGRWVRFKKIRAYKV